MRGKGTSGLKCSGEFRTFNNQSNKLSHLKLWEFLSEANRSRAFMTVINDLQTEN